MANKSVLILSFSPVEDPEQIYRVTKFFKDEIGFRSLHERTYFAVTEDYEEAAFIEYLRSLHWYKPEQVELIHKADELFEHTYPVHDIEPDPMDCMFCFKRIQ